MTDIVFKENVYQLFLHRTKNNILFENKITEKTITEIEIFQNLLNEHNINKIILEDLKKDNNIKYYFDSNDLSKLEMKTKSKIVLK